MYTFIYLLAWSLSCIASLHDLHCMAFVSTWFTWYKYYLLQSQESVIPSSGLRRQSVGSHDSPINPGSPILDDDSSGDQYKNCQYRSPIGSMGINAAFNSFPSPHHHHQSTALPHLATGMGYPSPSSMCPSSMYATQDSMCPGSVPPPPPPLGMPVWR